MIVNSRKTVRRFDVIRDIRHRMVPVHKSVAGDFVINWYWAAI